MPNRIGPLSVTVLAIGMGCSSVTPEQQALVDKVRVANYQKDVRGCEFIRSVTASERPPQFRWDGGVPAITVLRYNASLAGGDTVLLTSSETGYRHHADRYGSRAVSTTTMTGDAYRCGARLPNSPHSQPSPGAGAGADLGNATIRLRPVSGYRADGTPFDVPKVEWITVDADVVGNHVLVYYDWSEQNARVPLESCWLDKGLQGQCRQRERDGTVLVIEVDGRDLRAAQ